MAYYSEEKGRWEASRRVVLPTGAAWRARSWGLTEDEAEEKLERKIAAAMGLHDGTLRSFAENVYAPTVRYRSAKWKSQIIWVTEGYILPAFGHVRLEEITRPKVQAFFDALVKESEKNPQAIQRTSIGHVRKVFSAIMRLAWHDEIITRNPVEKISLPEAAETDVTLWTLDQFCRIVLCAEGTTWQLPIFLGGAFSMRVGEACGPWLADLRSDGWLDLDWQVQKLEAPNPKKDEPKYQLVHKKKLKTPGSHRSFPLPDGAMARILSMRYSKHASTLLCPNEDGGMLDPENASRALDQAIARANETIKEEKDKIPHGTFHHLRHTFKAICDDMGVPAPASRQLMGHKAKDISERYGGAYIERKRQTLGIFFDRLDQVEKQIRKVKGRGRAFSWAEVEKDAPS